MWPNAGKLHADALANCYNHVTHPMDPLAKVIAARRKQAKAREQLVDAIAEAVQAGVPQTQIAEALDLNRLTIWRWMNERSPRAADTAEGMTTSEATDEVHVP